MRLSLIHISVYQYDILLTRLREQAFLNAGVNIILSDKRDPENIKTKALCYEGGIKSYVEYRNQHKDVIHDEVIYLSAADGDTTAEIAIQYNDSYEAVSYTHLRPPG